MRFFTFLYIAAVVAGTTLVSSFETAKKTGGSRREKLLSLFQIVEFPNAICSGSGDRNGTCYTSSECTQLGGEASGSCASGYGVCCVFKLGCGQSSSQNCTYFQSSGSESGSCTASVCRANSNICQIRLDFDTFVIHGPSTNTEATGFGLTSGAVTVPADSAGTAATRVTQCLTDLFSVTNPGGTSPSPICGSNGGEHMYVDASSGCNQLIFQLGTKAVDTSSVSPNWVIKVTQYNCDYTNKAPPGCNQYFTGTSGEVRSFNYNDGNGLHLASQDQTICVRREKGYCRICWWADNEADFSISGKAEMGYTGTGCCGLGAMAMTSGYDCVMIPGPSNATPMTMIKAVNICGRAKGLGFDDKDAAMDQGQVSATICSRQVPFQIRFLSDAFEFGNEEGTDGTQTDGGTDRGFKLRYMQDNNNCNTASGR